MSKFIDTDVLLDFIKKHGYVDDDDCQFECPCEMNSAVEYIENYIKEMPTADVVEVIRCEDCKWFNQIVCKRMNKVMKSDGFCSNGERREDDKG